MNFQGAVMNVADLGQSIGFYRDVLEFTLLSKDEELAMVSAPGDDDTQVIVLLGLGNGHVGELAISV